MFFQTPRTDPALKISQAKFQWQNKNGKEHRGPEPGTGAGLHKAVDVRT